MVASDAWFRFSYSKLSASMMCPLRGFLEFIIDEDALTNPQAALGKALHFMFKLFFTPNKSTKRFPFEDKTIKKELRLGADAFQGAWKGFWWSAVKREKHGFGSRNSKTDPPEIVAWENKDQPGEYFARGLRILTDFYNANNLLRHDDIKRITERRFKLNLQALMIPGVTLTGVIDRIDLEKDGAVILDYKWDDIRIISYKPVCR